MTALYSLAVMVTGARWRRDVPGVSGDANDTSLGTGGGPDDPAK